MKIEIEEHDIDAIAERVVDAIRPYLSHTGRNRSDDTVFDVNGLCDYLHVTPKWVYEQTHLKAIPHYKLSNKTLRFRRSDIDKWMERLRTPAIGEPTGKFRLLK
jgi:excisionase family DNA binding protein